MATDNPYLAHYNVPKSKFAKTNGELGAKDPLFGWIPRKVKTAQVEKALVCADSSIDVSAFNKTKKNGDINPFTKQPHSANYKKILEARKKLPVYAQMSQFLDMVSRLVFRL